MTILSKIFLGLISLSGVGSAIGIPLSLTAGGKLIKGSGGGDSMQVSISQCENPTKQSGTLVGFGDNDADSVCWTIESGGEGIPHPEKYTELIQKQGSEKEQDGKNSANHGEWTPQCSFPEIQSQWVIFNSSNGTQYLGLCGLSDAENTKFIKKTREGKSGENKDEGTLGICNKDCGNFDESIMSGSARTFEEKDLKSGNWKQLKFYKN